jgi:rod shape determining protein RodA
MPSFYQIKTSQSFFDKVREINLTLVCLLVITFLFGLLSLYSIAGANFDPWARNHLIRFIVSSVLFTVICLVDIKIILKLAYPLFFLNILALILIIFIGYRNLTVLHDGLGLQELVYSPQSLSKFP